MSNFDVSILVKLFDQLTGPARGVQEAMRNMANSMRSAAASGMGNMNRFTAHAINSLAKTEAAFKNFGTRITGHWQSLQNHVFGSAFAAIGVEQLFANQLHFEEKIANIRALRLDREGKATAALREEILKLTMLYPVLGGKLGVAEGAEKLVQMGLSLEEAKQSLESVARAGAAAHVTTEEAAESMMHVIQGYNMLFRTGEEKAAAFARVGDVIFAANASFGGTFKSLGELMARGGPASAQTGLTFEQAAALGGILTMSGFTPTTSGFALSSIFQRTGAFQTSKTGKAVKAKLAEYGIDLGDYYHSRDEFRALGGEGIAKAVTEATGLNVMDMAAEFQSMAMDPVISSTAENLRTAMMTLINKRLGLDPNDKKLQGDLQYSLGEVLRKTYANLDFLSFIQDLAKSGAYRDTELMTKLAGVFQMPKLMDLIMKQITGDFDERNEMFRHKVTGATRTHLEIWNEGLIGAVKKMAGLWDYFTDKLFNASGLNESLNKLGQSFLGFSDGLKGLEAHKDVLFYVGAGLLAIAAAGAAGLVIWGVTAGLMALTNPLFLVAAGLGYLGFHLYRTTDGFKGWGETLKRWEGVLKGAGILAGVLLLLQRFKMLGFAINAVVSGIRLISGLMAANPWFALATGIAAVAAIIYTYWDDIVAFTEKAIGKLKSLISSITDALDAILKPLDSSVDKLFTFQKWPKDTLFREWRERRIVRAKSAETLPDRYGAAPASVTNNRTVNQSISAPITINVTQANATAQAIATAIAGAGNTLGAKLRAALQDNPQ